MLIRLGMIGKMFVKISVYLIWSGGGDALFVYNLTLWNYSLQFSWGLLYNRVKRASDLPS